MSIFIDASDFIAGNGTHDDTDGWASIASRARLAATAGTGWAGAVVGMPPGCNSLVNGGINLDGFQNFRIVGAGAQQGGSRIFTNRTDGGPVISAKGSTQSIQIEGIELFHNGPAGTPAAVLDATQTVGLPSNFLDLKRCYLVAPIAAGSQIDLLRIPNCISVQLDHVRFNGGRYSIQGRGAATDFINGLAIETCYFAGADLSHIHNLGQGTHIYGATIFEPLRSGAPGAILQDATIPIQGLKIDALWAGDSTVSGTLIIINGRGIVIEGSLIDGGTGLGTAIQFNATSDGISIKGNRLSDWTLGIDKNAQAVTNIELGPNSYASVTTHHNFTALGSPYVEA